MADFGAMLLPIYDQLGDTVTHTSAGGGIAREVKALFTAPGQNVLGGDVFTTDYAVRYRTAALPGVVRGDTFLISGTTYRAREDAQPLLDGTEARVLLERP